MKRISLNFIISSIICCLWLFQPLIAAAEDNDEYPQLATPATTRTAPKILSLNEAILLALRNNPDARSARLDRVVNKFALELAYYGFAPQYTFTSSATYQEATKPNYIITPQATLNTRIGTKYTASFNGNIQDGGNAVVNLSATQPLLRGFGKGIADKALLDAMDDALDKKLTYKNTLITTVVAVIKAYHTLVKHYNTLKTNQLALKDSEKQLHNYRIKYKTGRVALPEVTQQEATVARSQLAVIDAENQIKQSYQNLLVLLGLSAEAHIVIDQQVDVSRIIVPDLTKSMQTALMHNIDYQKILIAYHKLERDLLVAKDAQRWQLNADASVTKTITSSSAGTPTLVTINGITTFQTPVFVDNKMLSFNLSVPINDMQAQSQQINAQVALEKAHIALTQAKRKLITEVVNTVTNLKSQQQQILQSQALTNLDQKNYSNGVLKFAYGRLSALDLGILRNTLTNSQLNLTNTEIDYLDAYTDFDSKLGITLEKYGIRVDY